MTPMITIRQGSVQHWVVRAAWYALLAAGVLLIATKGSNSLIGDATNAAMLAICALGLNLVLGYSGMISIGHSAFYGVGAYATGILIAKHGWNPWWTFLVGFVAAFVVGMLVSLPALRIKGIYLALVTLSLAIVFPLMMKWKKLEWLTGGSSGLDDTTFRHRRFKIFGHDFFGSVRSLDGKTVFHYWIAIVLLAITFFVCRGLIASRVGRSLVAVRDNETAAAVMGVPLARTKALVFGFSAGLCALAGSLSTIRTGNVLPDSANLTVLGAIMFLVVMVIGGAGTLWGPIVGAIVYTAVNSAMSDWATEKNIPAVLRPLLGWARISPATGVFALALIVLMFVAPFGLVGLWRRAIVRLVGVVPPPVEPTHEVLSDQPNQQSKGEM